jgi:DNA-binding transcriptional regulator GbsR (MarR family)
MWHMTDDQNVSESVRDEFQKLGRNIRDMFSEAWNSEDRKRISRDIEVGLTEVGETISRTAREVTESEGMQQVRDEMEDLGERIRSGEVARKLESDLVTILQAVNSEIERVSSGEPQDMPGNEEDDNPGSGE